MAKHSILYVIQHEDTGLHKIGITNDWSRRQRELELGIKTKAVHVVRVNDARQIESYLHRRFKAQRMPQSEWFNLDGEQLNFVRSTVLKARDDYRGPRDQIPAPGGQPLTRPTSKPFNATTAPAGSAPKQEKPDWVDGLQDDLAEVAHVSAALFVVICVGAAVLAASMPLLKQMQQNARVQHARNINAALRGEYPTSKAWDECNHRGYIEACDRLPEAIKLRQLLGKEDDMEYPAQ